MKEKITKLLIRLFSDSYTKHLNTFNTFSLIGCLYIINLLYVALVVLSNTFARIGE